MRVLDTIGIRVLDTIGMQVLDTMRGMRVLDTIGIRVPGALADILQHLASEFCSSWRQASEFWIRLASEFGDP